MVPGKEYIHLLKKVRGRVRDHSDNLVGNINKKPILETRIYDIDFTDGRV